MLVGEQNENGNENPIPKKEVDSIEMKAWAARPSTPMHITDWAQAQQEDLELKATLEWCLNDKKKGTPWVQQLEKLKAHLGSFKNQPVGKCIVRNADALTLSGCMLYYQHSPKYLEKIKRFLVLRAHQQMALNGCHRDADHQGKKRTLSLVTNRFWWPGLQEAAESVIVKDVKLMGELSPGLLWSPYRQPPPFNSCI